MATDLGASSAEVVRSAARLASAAGAELHVLHAVGETVQKARKMEAHRSEALEWIRERIRAARLPDETAYGEVIIGEPGARIGDTASRTDAELIVVGSRGTVTMSRLLLGSVSRAVLRGPPCPVFVVRDPEASRAAEARAWAGGAGSRSW